MQGIEGFSIRRRGVLDAEWRDFGGIHLPNKQRRDEAERYLLLVQEGVRVEPCLFRLGSRLSMNFELFRDSVRKLVDEMKDHKIFRHPVQIKRKFNLGGSTEKDVEENWEENNDSDGLQSSKNGCASELSQEGGLGMGVQIEKREYLPFERQLLDLHKYHKSELRLKVAKELQKIIVSTFNSCAVYSYGTDALGVSLDSDEIRFCIDPYGTF